MSVFDDVAVICQSCILIVSNGLRQFRWRSASFYEIGLIHICSGPERMGYLLVLGFQVDSWFLHLRAPPQLVFVAGR